LRGEQETLAWDKCKGIAVDPFIGRGAPLNRAIAYVLGIEQPQTTRQISKNVCSIPFFRGTSASTVNKRVRDLEKREYLKKAQVNQRVGGITNYYQLTPNLELAAYLDTHTPKELFTDIKKDDTATILADLKKAQERKKSA
jgi:predicted transcriptional regulator